MRLLMPALLALAACGPGSDAAPPALSEARQGRVERPALSRVEEAKPRTIDPAEFLSKAVMEGLTEDGADPAFVKECLADKRELFVTKCPICEPVRLGFSEYGHAKPLEKPEGKGIPKDIVDELKHAARLARLNALERLVDRYVSRHYERLKLTAEERRTLQATLEERKKDGMEMKRLGSPTFGDFCPSCNGAAKQR